MNRNPRFIRQTGLPNFGVLGQSKLETGRVLVVGLGGLGIPVANYLNAMGVGTIGLVEQDNVELHNLQRQVLYAEKDVGKPKIEVVLEKLKAQNSETHFKVFDTFLTKDNALKIIKDFDVVVDATDNFPTRYLINDACVLLDKPFVYGALHGFEGQVSVFNYQGGPTYRCLFSNPPSNEEIPNCDENGVLGVIPGIVGTLQALETVKVLTGVGEVLTNKLLLFDGLTQSTIKINFDLNPENKKMTKLQKSYDFVTCSREDSITSEDLMRILRTKKLQLVDVRTEKEFTAHHIKGTLNIPLQELENAMEKLDFDQTIYLICQTGKRAMMAFQQLKTNHPQASLIAVSGGMANIPIHARTR